MRCPSCGGTSGVGSFCIFCGMKLEQPAVPLKRDDMKSLRYKLQPIVNDRDRTDAHVSPAWIIVPFIAAIILGVAMVAVVFVEVLEAIESDEYDPDDPFASYDALSGDRFIILNAIGVTVYLVLARLTHDLVKRNNEHFARERRFREAVISFASLNGMATSQFYLPEGDEPRRSPIAWAVVIALPGLMSLVYVVLMAIESGNRDPNWTAFALIALLQLGIGFLLLIAQFYLFYFLTKETANHHKRWMWFVHETKIFLGSLGVTAGWLTEPYRLPDRSVAVYIIVSIFTGGLFFFYWWYAIIKDGNRHFEHHSRFEDEFMQLLSGQRIRAPEGSSITWV